MSEKVLLVDDEEDFLEAMSERMTARGMEVTTASSAKEAIDIIDKISFDAIILDFQMPEMDGMEALQTIKAKRPESQIILLTGYATLEKGVEAMKIGATDFIEKPADLEVLSDKIKKAKAERMLIADKQQAEQSTQREGDRGLVWCEMSTNGSQHVRLRLPETAPQNHRREPRDDHPGRGGNSGQEREGRHLPELQRGSHG